MLSKKLAVIVLAVVLLAGGTYAYSQKISREREDKIETPATKTDQPEKVLTPVTKQKPNQDRVFPEIGVSMNVSDNFVYSVSKNPEPFAGVTRLSFSTKGDSSACLLGIVTRVNKDSISTNQKTNDKFSTETFQSMTKTNGEIPPMAKEFGSFYLVYEGPQSACRNVANPLPDIRTAMLGAVEI